MLKKGIYAMLLASLLLACSDNSDTSLENVEQATEELSAVAPNVTVEGIVENGGNQKLFLEANTGDGIKSIGETITNEDGSFSLQGGIRDMGLYQLRLGEPAQSKVIPLTLVPGDEVILALEYDDFGLSPLYKGTEWAEPLNGYMEEMRKFIDWQKTIPDPTIYTNEELMAMIIKYKAPIDNYIITQINKDPENPANILLMTNLMPMLGLDNYEESNLETLKVMLNAYQIKYPENVVTLDLAAQVFQLEREFKDFQDFRIKSIAPEIDLPNPDGKNMKLSSLKGKYVLIDFWASWCMPCRQENPNVVRLYNKYEKENFEIFSVSLDKDKEKWIEAIEKDGLRWKNHVSDLMYWQTPLTEKYHFNAIPHTVLIDPNGKIIAENLRGPALERKLVEIFGK